MIVEKKRYIEMAGLKIVVPYVITIITGLFLVMACSG